MTRADFFLVHHPALWLADEMQGARRERAQRRCCGNTRADVRCAGGKPVDKGHVGKRAAERRIPVDVREVGLVHHRLFRVLSVIC